MPNATTTLRPDGVAVNAAGWTVAYSGSPPSPNTLERAAADDSDNTWAQVLGFPTSGLTLEFTMGTFSFPALAQIRSVTPRVRQAGGSFTQNMVVRASGQLAPNSSFGPGGGVLQTFTGATLTTSPDGDAWTQADIDSLQFGYYTSNLDSQVIQVEEAYIDVAYNRAPTVSSVTPSGTITTTAQPTIGWAFSDLDGDAQERFRVKVYSGTGTVANPDVTASLVDSDVVFSGTSSWVLNQSLPAGSYRVYVKAADVGSGGRFSAWATGTFTLQIDAPAAPTVTATADSTAARIGVFVQGEDNMLSVNQASLETDVSGWWSNGSCTVARSTTQALHGAASLAMTANATGNNMAARSAATLDLAGYSASGLEATPSRTYVAMGWFRAATVGRRVAMQMNFYDAAGAQTGSANIGLRVHDNTSGWVQAWVTAVAPANAAWILIIPTVYEQTSGEVHYVDQLFLGPLPVRSPNLLSADQSGFEATLTGTYWAGEGGTATVARTTAVADEGTAAMAITVVGSPSTAIARITANPTPTGLIPVSPRFTYTQTARVRSAAVPRYVSAQINWYTSAGSYISSTSGSGVTTTTTGWQTTVSSGVAPDTAAYAGPGIQVQGSPAAGEVHYVDTVRFSVADVNHLSPAQATFNDGLAGWGVPSNTTLTAIVGNMLSWNQAGVEVDASGFQAGTNATVARSTDQAASGVASLSMTSGASGNMVARTTAGVGGVRIQANTQYSAVAEFRAAASGRSATVSLVWYDSAGTWISTNTSSSVTDTTTGWVQATVTATSPSNAVFAAVELTVVATGAASEVHYVDRLGLFVGTNTVWYSGGSYPLDGSGVLQMVSAAAGTMSAKNSPASGTGAVPAAMGQSFTGIASYRAATTARTVQINLNFRNAAGVPVQTINGTTATDTTTGWTTVTVTGTATDPTTTAVTIELQVNSTGAAGEFHFVDAVTLARTEDLGWTAGGRATGAAVIVERSLDGGGTWKSVRGGEALAWDDEDSQSITVYDYEVARNTPALYRARIVSTIGTLVSSSPYGQTSLAVAQASTGWWLKDPLAPATNLKIEVQPGFSFKRKKPQTVLEPVGRDVSVVIHDGVRGIEGELTVWAKDAAQYAKLETLVNSGHSLWLEDAFGRAWYIDLGSAVEWSLLRAQPTAGETTPIRHLHTVTLPFVEVGPPSG